MNPVSENPRSDNPKPEGSRPENTRPEPPRAEGPRTESPRPEGQRESPRTENPRPEGARAENPRYGKGKSRGYRGPRQRPRRSKEPCVSIIPLGGVGEIGKNMMVFEYEDDIIVVDAGVKFPGEELLGIDLVIPDTTYLQENAHKVRGICLTHGHEDHIGALPFVLRKLKVPIYGTRLALGLVKNKLQEHGLLRESVLHEVSSSDKVQLGTAFEVEFFHVNHSIPDGVGLAIRTPVGMIIHSGDFKLDQTPVDDKVIEFNKIARFGDEGVLAFICDTTNVERPGYTPSERTVGETFEALFSQAKQRIIVATFASNVHRIQQVVNVAVENNRRIAVVGRSMVTVVDVAQTLGYLSIPKGMLIDLDEVDRLPDNQIVIITTGSQGEPMAALTRMATNNHRQINIRPGDTVIISATPIPGNEKLVARTIDNLFRIGAEVIYRDIAAVHVSGHAAQQEIALMLNMLRPKYAIPFHGEYRHQATFSKVAQSLGVPKENVLICNIGDRMELGADFARFNGRVDSGSVMVDGIGVGDVGNIVLRDRHHLAQDGVVIAVVTINKETGSIVAGPDLVSRGFVFVREAGDLLGEAKHKVREALSHSEVGKVTEWSVLKNLIRESLCDFFYRRTRRRPIVLPIIMEF